MGYSDDPAMVRVDFFKPNGKWYTTEAVKWTGSYSLRGPGSTLIHEAFRKSLRDHFIATAIAPGTVRLRGLRAICLEPYHEHACPICLDIPEEGPL